MKKPKSSPTPESRNTRESMIVIGSWGTLVVDGSTGCILEYEPELDYPEDDYWHIQRFDLEEYRRHYPSNPTGTIDILDIGYWTVSGDYEPPEPDYRKEVACFHR